jgi:hypothetical protein
MTRRNAILLSTAVGLAVGTGWITRSRADAPRHASPAPREGGVVVTLCDGETSAEVKGVVPGQPLSRAQAQAVSDQLMVEWRRKNPNAHWDDGARLAQAVQVPETQPGAAPAPAAPKPVTAEPGSSQPPAPAEPGKAVQPAAPAAAGEAAPQAAERVGRPKTPEQAAAQGETPAAAGGMPAGAQGPVQDGHTYGNFSDRDVRIWQAETEKFVNEGNRIFHSAELLGGTIGVSCDMCHPDGANTHPETYPKFQVQFGRVALLRDMINWCIENPTRGRPLPDDDVRLKALEAYILAQRKGVPLEYGKR